MSFYSPTFSTLMAPLMICLSSQLPTVPKASLHQKAMSTKLKIKSVSRWPLTVKSLLKSSTNSTNGYLVNQMSLFTLNTTHSSRFSEGLLTCSTQAPPDDDAFPQVYLKNVSSEHIWLLGTPLCQISTDTTDNARTTTPGHYNLF